LTTQGEYPKWGGEKRGEGTSIRKKKKKKKGHRIEEGEKKKRGERSKKQTITMGGDGSGISCGTTKKSNDTRDSLGRGESPEKKANQRKKGFEGNGNEKKGKILRGRSKERWVNLPSSGGTGPETQPKAGKGERNDLPVTGCWKDNHPGGGD